ncbi:MAG TPA: S-methyl-5-thioribose kinase [Streptosporangiaceae bacterium]|jgi:5-methylthioribose kinase|nr:S-methyl-5-thioribose kinase [Streptosporangiaceae bacterium]
MIRHSAHDLLPAHADEAASGYPAYRELTEATVGAYAARFLDGPVCAVDEVGDGNLNLVFRVRGPASSVIVKQALPYLKAAGRQWPLTRERAHIESDAIAVHNRCTPGLLPVVLFFDEAQSAIVLEDLDGYRSWRDILIDGHPSPGVPAQVGWYSAAILMGTANLDTGERDQLRHRFGYSELCLVTEDLVFTAPFTGAASNRYDDELTGLVRALRRDRQLRMAVSGLLSAFKTRGETLIHGDLHTGSVLVRGQQARVIDLEFAYYGPFGFDPGMLLANLALAYIAHEAVGELEFCATVAGFAREYWSALASGCRQQWSTDEFSCHQFLSALIADAGRFAGVEMIRRIVGLAHVQDIDSLPQSARLRAQQHAVSCGRTLITGPVCHGIDEFWLRATKEGTLG